jgi:2-phosphosulfolactate phosphatase
MRADLFFTLQQTDEFVLRNRTVVVIDVLRAGTTIAAAIASGAKEIIPVTTVERAVKISGSLFGDYILRGGERNGKMIEGFNLGNSPAEYTPEKVKGKAIIYSTTNGSRAIDKARYAQEMAVCSFVNLSTVARFLRDLNKDFSILCAGNNGLFSIEDTVCAGMLVHQMNQEEGLDLSMSDAVQAAVALYKSFGRSIPKMIRNSEHGKYLAQIGFKDDLELCAAVDTIDVLPRLVGSVVKLKREADSKEAAGRSVSAR